MKMPHIVLECSENLDPFDFQFFMKEIHETLVLQLPTKLEACKSRLILYKEFRVADGNPNNAFAHLNISVMPGREPDLLNSISETILEKMKTFFILPNSSNPILTSIWINELPLTYRK